MRRLVPVLVLAAVAAAAAVFLLGGDDDESLSLPVDRDVAGPEGRRPELMATEAVRRRKEANAQAARERAAAERNAPPPEATDLFLRGIVLDDATGRPVAGALVWAEAAQAVCPRLPHRESYRVLQEAGWATTYRQPSVTLRPTSVGTGPDGRFTWRVERSTAPGPRTHHDVFASAPGHVTAVVCDPTPGSEITIRLPKALRLKVLVTDQHGRPVPGATVRAAPSGDTPPLPGHAGVAGTDEAGRCEIDGLLPGEILVTADHPAFMPTAAEPFDPSLKKEVEISLPPAMRFSFTLRSDDGSEIHNPTLQWQTDGQPPHQDLLLLRATASGPPNAPAAEVQCAAVRIPCDHANVQFELKADGFEAIRPPAEPLPGEGGKKEGIVVLVRDTTLAPLRVRFVDPEGKPVPYGDLGAAPPSILSLDGKEIGSVTFVGGEALFFESLPAGRYRIGKRSPAYAPAEVDVDVRAGETNEVIVKLRPTAKLKVVFRAGERIVVRFRLRREGRILPAFPASAQDAGTSASGLSPLEAGADGEVFTGLGAGSVTVDVTDPTLVAEAKTVTLREGETSEIEIDVRKR